MEARWTILANSRRCCGWRRDSTTPLLRYRQGGDPRAWARPGGTAYLPAGAMLLAGSARWTGTAAASGQVTLTFPARFADEPLLLVSVARTTPLYVDARCQALGEAAVGRITWYAAAPVTEVWFQWLALGMAGS